jgi:predicted PurR-regulated permease PerM
MGQESKTTVIEISPKTIITILVILFCIWFLFAIRSILVIAFLALILTSTMKDPIDYLIAHKFPKGIAIIFTYFCLLAITLGFFTVIAAPIAQETIRFINNLPDILDKIINIINDIGLRLGFMTDETTISLFERNMNTWLSSLSDNLGDILKTSAQGASGILDLLSGVFGGIMTVLLIFVISIYMSFDHDNALEALLRQIPTIDVRKKVGKLIKDIERNLGRWLVGQMISSSVLATLTWAILTVLGVQYALPLGLLTGLLNPIPFVGATLSAIPGIIVALSSGSLLQIIGVPITYLIVQQIESQITTPRIMSNAIGLPPIITILAVLIGGQIGGTAGVLLAVPIAGVVHLGLRFWEENRYDENG